MPKSSFLLVHDWFGWGFFYVFERRNCIYGGIKMPSLFPSPFQILNTVYSLCELIPVLPALLC